MPNKAYRETAALYRKNRPALCTGRWGLPSTHALGWAMVATDRSLARSTAPTASIFLGSDFSTH